MNCLAARFVAFSSQFELQAHMVSAHSQNMTKEQQQAARQIEVCFILFIVLFLPLFLPFCFLYFLISFFHTFFYYLLCFV
jgi:hypothetical protein